MKTKNLRRTDAGNKISKLAGSMLQLSSFLKKKKLSVYGCFAFVYIYGPYASSIHRSQDRAPDPLELDLQMFVSSYVGAGEENPGPLEE